MKILVTGAEGYLGTLLVPLLLDNNYEVTGIDTGFFRFGYLYNSCAHNPVLLTKDVRRLTSDDIKGYDMLIHMAELSNDPIGELNPDITYDINHKSTVRLANLAKQCGVKRFIYMSSCSVYGFSNLDLMDEDSPLNPQTSYAICKTLCERDIMLLANSNFSPVILRNSTAYGASPRQRFDLVVNNLCGMAWTEGVIKMSSDGSPWRPLVHGYDIARAICEVIKAPLESIHAQVFNVGSNDQNYRIKDIACAVGKEFAGCDLILDSSSKDSRSYRVEFGKLSKHIPHFKCLWNLETGISQLHKLFRMINLTKEDFYKPEFTRIKQLKHLINTNQIDSDFYWNQEFNIYHS
jgi:nucleoside-diphosphate-sugar epimerase